jgi:soluble lytic murein transglycosylase-like protein
MATVKLMQLSYFIRTITLALLLLIPFELTASEVDAEKAELRDFLKQTINDADSFNDRFDAEVWLLAMSGRLEKFIADPKERLLLLKAIHREATQANLKPDLVLALIEVESHFDNYAVSRAGAQGLMQVMPFWKKEIGRPDDNLTNIETNLRYGCRILQFYLEKEEGVWMDALARYNGSYGQYWYPERVMNAWRARWYTADL